MIFSNDKISIRQMISILILDIFGTSIIILPQKSAILAEQNGWMLVVMTGILALISAILITTLCQKGENLNFYEQTKENLSPIVGMIIISLFIVKNILIISYELSVFTSMTSQILLPRRNLTTIYLSMIVVSSYCAMQGIEVRARLSEILVVLLLVSLAFSLVIVSIDADFKNVLPMHVDVDFTFFKNSMGLIFGFMGLDYLYLIYPYVTEKNKYRKGGIVAVSILGLLMVIITVIAIANYNYVTLAEQRWPVIDMISEVNFLGAYFERQDALIMSFWIMGVFSSVTAGIYYSTVLIMDLVPKLKTNWVVGFLGVITFFITEFFMGINLNDGIVIDVIVWLMLFFLFVFPVISLIIVAIRNKRGLEDEK